MKIAISKYLLYPPEKIQRLPREGALIRIMLPNGTFGYADCHPWTEFGDFSLETQLQLLGEGKETRLTQQSIAFALIDGNARLSKINLFQNLPIPKSHAHIFNDCLLNENLLEQFKNHGIYLVKVKVGLNSQNVLEMIKALSQKLRNAKIKLRLDFNCKLTEDEFLNFLEDCKPHLDLIDFFEDPFSYDPIRWQKVRETEKINLACDRESQKAIDYPNSCDFLVIKPAVQPTTPFLSDKIFKRQLIFTSYLDHPIGQLTAAYVAAKMFKEKRIKISACGFLTHHAYQTTSFSQSFKQLGAQLLPSLQGYGWGYDSLLEELKWIELR